MEHIAQPHPVGQVVDDAEALDLGRPADRFGSTWRASARMGASLTSRLIRFDKRGMGLSDRVSEMPTISLKSSVR